VKIKYFLKIWEKEGKTMKNPNAGKQGPNINAIQKKLVLCEPTESFVYEKESVRHFIKTILFYIIHIQIRQKEVPP
jgi:hypothetical protein